MLSAIILSFCQANYSSTQQLFEDKSADVQATSFLGGMAFGSAEKTYGALDVGLYFRHKSILSDAFLDIGYAGSKEVDNGYFVDNQGKCREANGRYAKKELCNGEAEFLLGLNLESQYYSQSRNLFGGLGIRLGELSTPYVVGGFKFPNSIAMLSLRLWPDYFHLMFSLGNF